MNTAWQQKPRSRNYLAGGDAGILDGVDEDEFNPDGDLVPGMVGVSPEMLRDSGDSASEVSPPAAPSRPDPNAGYLSAADRYAGLLGQRPVQTPPKWWERLAAGAIGGLAGWSNAASRTKNPIDIAGTSDAILHPGFQNRLAEWQSRVAPAEALLELEGKKLSAREREEQIRAQAEERIAHAQQRQNMAAPHYNQVQLDPAWAKTNLPGHAPDASGQYWIDKTQAVEMEKEAAHPIIIPAGSTAMQGGRVIATGGPKPATSMESLQAQAFLREHPNATAQEIADFKAAQKPDPATQENPNHWIAIAEDPDSTPVEKALANGKLRRLQQNQVQTHISINNSSPQNQPAQAVREGSAEDKVAHDLAFGKLTFPQFARLYSYSRDIGKKLAIYQRAEELNPGNFNPALFEQGYKFFSTPKIQQQMASLNNVEAGVADLLKFSDLASRSGATILNKAIIPGGLAVGGRMYSDFNTARTAFADELSGALGYGSATDMSREMGFNMTDRNLSPENFKSAIKDVIVPFVQRKRASLMGPMGIYGQPPAQSTGRASGTNVPPAATSTPMGIMERHGLK